MKSGKYLVSFEVDLTDCKDEEEAQQEVASMVSEMLDEDNFPEVDFELLEELDLEYNSEEGGLQELNF
jgi:hypothetical protein